MGLSAHAQLVTRGAPAQTSAPVAVAPNPAALGGIFVSGPQTAAALMTPTLQLSGTAVTQRLFLPSPMTRRTIAVGANAGAAPIAASKLTIGAQAEVAASAALAPAQAIQNAASQKDAPAGSIEGANATAFDGTLKLSHDVGGTDGLDGGGVFNGGGNGGSNDGNNNGGGDDHLNNGQTRTALILDTFDGPAPDQVVANMEKMLDQGIHVVFITARPEKGENSAESVLTARMKSRTTNPLIVVSYNGARVTAKNSRAENPKPLLEDLPGLPQNSVEKFRTIGETVKKKLGVSGDLKEFGEPSVEKAYIYGAELPAGVDAKKWTSTFNRALKDAGLLYKIETITDASGKSYYYTQSTALKLNTARIFNALYSVFPHLDPAKEPAGGLRSEQVLVVANPAKAPSFLRTLDQDVLRGEGFSIQGAQDAAGVLGILDAVLGKNALDKVYVSRSELKDYVAWVARQEKWGRSSSGGFTPNSKKGKQTGMYRVVAFYRAIILKDFMGRIYHSIRQGQYEDATPEAAVMRLTQMWNWPEQQGVRLPAELQAIRYNPAWNRAKKQGLDSAVAWVRNYYRHNFRDYPLNISEKVVSRMVNLARDGGNAVQLDYTDRHTRRRYVVGVDPDRVEVREDEHGEYLVTHVYRTGNEVLSKTYHESVEVNIVARGALEGYAVQDEATGIWYLNDKPNPRVKVVYHYMTRELPRFYTPEELMAKSTSVTALIERMKNDKDYQAELEKREAAEEKAKKAALRVLQKNGKGPKAKAKGK
ncbi:MAG: hypothetical protein HY925_06125 [Elusimicrobia bacterium]|nr:hypothetical protein [Elusimicrobiota bacterium]